MALPLTVRRSASGLYLSSKNRADLPLDGNVPGIQGVHAARLWGQIALDGQHIALDVHQLSDDRVICVLSVWKILLELHRGLLLFWGCPQRLYHNILGPHITQCPVALTLPSRTTSLTEESPFLFSLPVPKYFSLMVMDGSLGRHGSTLHTTTSKLQLKYRTTITRNHQIQS